MLKTSRASGTHSRLTVRRERRPANHGCQTVVAVTNKATPNQQAALNAIIAGNGSDQVARGLDGAIVLKAPFQTCLPEGCIVQSQLGPDGIEAMHSEADAIVALLPSTSVAPFEVTISLRGFSAAWNRLSEF